MTRSYKDVWDSYWRDVTPRPGAAFWDSTPDHAVQRELPLFAAAFDPQLPVVDVGCGNGRQTRGLADAFSRVLGVDVSEGGLRGARAHHAAANVEYRALDLLDGPAVRALHAEIGDANLYLRGVLHQLQPADRPAAVHHLAALLGERGRVFLVELSPAAGQLFASLARGHGGPPAKLQQIVSHGITPALLPAGELAALFHRVGFVPRAQGVTTVVTTQALPDGEIIEVPCEYFLFQRADA
ncbi:MAG: methyltransferase domain-containing protein [Deltaproteobacteria bacterium]|nr:MAG: methyltransferase domain-containing protein [Deltaproteobacteria bacterium]TMQ26663.1 MAG: methyltransferase domain-containing protein [Deltaproteobacteria bacterium]